MFDQHASHQEHLQNEQSMKPKSFICENISFIWLALTSNRPSSPPWKRLSSEFCSLICCDFLISSIRRNTFNFHHEIIERIIGPVFRFKRVFPATTLCLKLGELLGPPSPSSCWIYTRHVSQTVTRLSFLIFLHRHHQNWFRE